MNQLLFAAIATLALTATQASAVEPFPIDFVVREIQTDGAVIYTRIGGTGPAVVLLHGARSPVAHGSPRRSRSRPTMWIRA